MKQTIYKKSINHDKIADTFALTKIGDKSFVQFITKHEGFFFTEEQLKQVLSDYTDKIVENAEIKNTGFIGENGWVDSQEIDKESITNQLDLFIKTIT